MLTREPKQGDTVEYEHDNNGPIDRWAVHHTRDSICYSQADEQEDGKCFIWKFADGELNKMFTIVE